MFSFSVPLFSTLDFILPSKVLQNVFYNQLGYKVIIVTKFKDFNP